VLNTSKTNLLPVVAKTGYLLPKMEKSRHSINNYPLPSYFPPRGKLRPQKLNSKGHQNFSISNVLCT